MARPAKTRYTMASFPRLRQLREEVLGWEVTEVLSKLPEGKPSLSSIYRLERGGSIRFPHARKVFDVVNAALGKTLDPEKEIKLK